MVSCKSEVVSLNIINSYFLGIRETNFPVYQKQFKQIDLELFISLADSMGNLTELEKNNYIQLVLEDLKKFLMSIESKNYSRTVQRMLLDMKTEIAKII
ncbi:hypothetical protein [Enterococcus faecalis]|uniref:hypothetical protein n=1 Tax=Enterococcus faecalis TaxID=1351 RepID=UPI0013309382|nr:hypothetical protein [Enterococcus faecalis]